VLDEQPSGAPQPLKIPRDRPTNRITVPRSTKSKRPIVGLEMEPGSVTAATVSVDGGGLYVASTATAPLPPNVIRDGEVADPETLTEALRALFRDNNLDRRVRIGVANQRIVVRVMDLPPVENPTELAAVVRFQADGELPMRLDEAVIDYQALGIVETPEGPRQRVVLVAARRQMIEEIVAVARAAGLRPQGIDLSAFAMVRALADQDEALTLFLSIGGLTNVAIAKGTDVVFTRVSGSGLEGMASVYSERRGVPIDEARELLARVGVEGPIEPGAEEEEGMARAALIDGIRRIAGDARASLDFHHTANPAGGSVERVIVTGPAVGIPGFLEALAQEIGLPIIAGSVAGAESEVDGARFAVAAGLAVSEVPA
jgi:type IV pilus assembly protein PilM